MVYPTLLAAISDASHPTWRARSLSVYRFWCDLGYAIGGLITGVIGDVFGLAWAIAAVGMLTFASGLIVAGTMKKTTALNATGVCATPHMLSIDPSQFLNFDDTRATMDSHCAFKPTFANNSQ
jgi:MFS family permease